MPGKFDELTTMGKDVLHDFNLFIGVA